MGGGKDPVKFECQINNKLLASVSMSQILHGTCLPWILSAALT